jgi:hypothetical protein
MLAAAEADFELNAGNRQREQRAKVSRCRALEIDRKSWQQRVEQERLLRAKLVPFAPAEEGALRMCRSVGQRSARLS